MTTEAAQIDGLTRWVEVLGDEGQRLKAELAALKARRCDGCNYYTRSWIGRRCAEGIEDMGGAHVRPDFSCKLWEAKA